MKKLLKFVVFVGALAGAAWALRDQLMPPPQTPTGSPPAFRTSPPSSTPAPRAERLEPEVGDDLTRVSGVGPVRMGLLSEAGISSFAQLAAADAAELAEQLGVAISQTSDWINQAADLA